jgi:lysophospholipid acyltransferase (LPLAT)-like uncharacterized protein
MRWDVDDLSGLFMNPERTEPVIVALWHNQLGLALASYHRHYNPLRPHRRLATMVSASRDGGFLAHAMQLMNLHPIRGSSSRRGAQALREFITAARQGFDLAITPDGPRGPRYKVQEGVLAAAQLTGLPIVPAVHRAYPAYTIHSWDQFQIPYPFARCRVTFGPPIHVPRNCTEDQRQSLRQHLENELLREPI